MKSLLRYIGYGFFFQNPEGKVLENSIDALIARSKDVQKALDDFLHKIEHQHTTLSW